MDATLRIGPHHIQSNVSIVHVRCIEEALINVGVVPPLLKVLVITHSPEVIDVEPRDVDVVLDDCLVVQHPLEWCEVVVV